MDTQHHLNKFDTALKLLVGNAFKADEVKVGMWLDSVVLKIQRGEWLGNPPLQPFRESVFFSVWVSDESLQAGKLYYNIHALNMREVKNYSIKSRDFAEAFRKAFQPFEKDWPNVSTQFGPQTLMQGWVIFDDQPETTAHLALNFTKIQFIIDDLFDQFRK